MTFFIFDENARKTIADHVLGTPPSIPNRSGANLGTDLLVQGVANVTPGSSYTPGGGGGRYTPGGSYTPGGGGGGVTPPPTGLSATAQITCQNGFQANNSGHCPPGVVKNGKRYTFTREVGANGVAFCCPQPHVPGSTPQTGPPINVQDAVDRLCSGDKIGPVYRTKESEYNTPQPDFPFKGQSFAQYGRSEAPKCMERGGHWVQQTFDQNGTKYIFATCCKDKTPQPVGPTPTPPYPPTVKTPTGPTRTGSYDGDKDNTTPATPSFSQIVYRARPLADIPAGGLGWCATEMDLISFAKDDCTKITGATLTTAKSTGSNLPTDCSKSTQEMIFARNPGAAVIERGVPIIAVRDFTGATGGVVRATIVVVPCAT
jgi:hypothetical protein